ncbi:MAG: sigma-70 family RNA polymerase sigma factor [Trebonia sp.]
MSSLAIYQPAEAATTSGAALAELRSLHGPALMRFARKLTLGDWQRAEDIFQETMTRAWRHPEIVEGSTAALRPWLFTVARRVAIDLWRARSRGDEIIDNDQAADQHDRGESIERAAAAIDVRAALERLPAARRRVIVEMYFLDRPVAEIARTLGIPEGTVKSRAYHAVRQLRELMGPQE